jgi:hypothetical protein
MCLVFLFAKLSQNTNAPERKSFLFFDGNLKLFSAVKQTAGRHKNRPALFRYISLFYASATLITVSISALISVACARSLPLIE